MINMVEEITEIEKEETQIAQEIGKKEEEDLIIEITENIIGIKIEEHLTEDMTEKKDESIDLILTTQMTPAALIIEVKIEIEEPKTKEDLTMVIRKMSIMIKSTTDPNQDQNQIDENVLFVFNNI